MKNFYNFIKILLGTAIITLFIGCNEKAEPSLFDLVTPSKNIPTITSITSPTEFALAGITVLTILGNNFSPKVEDNAVYFDGKKGTVLSASSTKLEVRSPGNVFGDSVKIRLTVFKNENISNTFIYRIVNPISFPYPFDPKVGDIPWAVTALNNGDLFVALEGKGIKKISNSIMTDYIPKGTETYWNNIKIIPDGRIYSARNLRGIWRLTQNTLPPTSPWALTPSGSRVWDFDWDQNQNIWAVGNNNQIYRISPTAVVTAYNFVANLRAVKFFNNYLYVGGVKDNLEKVWRFPITSTGDLGPEEEYINLSAIYPNIIINTITFNIDGVLYIGTNKKPNPIIEVKPNKTVSELYPGIIPASEVFSFYWPQGEFLYFIRKAETGRDQTVIRLNMIKNGAPNYGN